MIPVASIVSETWTSNSDARDGHCTRSRHFLNTRLILRSSSRGEMSSSLASFFAGCLAARCAAGVFGFAASAIAAVVPSSPRAARRRADQSLTSAVLGDGGVDSSIDDLAHWLAIVILTNRNEGAPLDLAVRIGVGSRLALMPRRPGRGTLLRVLTWEHPSSPPHTSPTCFRGEIVGGQEALMATPRPSVTKRQREQVKREKKRMKAEKRAQRKLERSVTDSEDHIQEDHIQEDNIEAVVTTEEA
ncbi:MAG TPA: hypothetical protein VNA04_05405 [Thermoanaerobaculia bacterium]|nr:hypothetical protein [Thermoanaerobaculia bacterium]